MTYKNDPLMKRLPFGLKRPGPFGPVGSIGPFEPVGPVGPVMPIRPLGTIECSLFDYVTVRSNNDIFENFKDGPRKIKNSTALDSFFDDMDQELEQQYEEEEFEFFLMGKDSSFCKISG